MPLYEYECGRGHKSVAFRDIEGRNDPHSCPECGNPTRHILSPVRIVGMDQERPYYDPGLGEIVSSKRQADEIGKRKGLRRREGRTGAITRSHERTPINTLIRIAD